MAKHEIKIPAVAESITEVDIGEWRVSSGDYVNVDDVLLVMDSDKASMDLTAEVAGVVEVTVAEGETVEVNSIVGTIDTEASAPAGKVKQENTSVEASIPETPPTNRNHTTSASPAAKKLAAEKGIETSEISGSGKSGMVTKQDVLAHKGPVTPKPTQEVSLSMELPKANANFDGPREERKKMSSLRRKIASRLVMAQHTAAILTTFNEIDMTNVMTLRKQYKDAFEKKHDIRLGFMGFFTKAVVEALKAYPSVNSYIDGTDLVQRNFYDISIAVSGKKGLVVPVLRDTDMLSIAEIEKAVKYYALKARDGSLSVEEMTGGGFTISNGGVFGSLLSTPILNPPQTGILGLHKIEERPIAVNGQVEIRPMMYVALSYDHRVIDGQQSVGFLVRVKEIMEEPSRILLEV